MRKSESFGMAKVWRNCDIIGEIEMGEIGEGKGLLFAKPGMEFGHISACHIPRRTSAVCEWRRRGAMVGNAVVFSSLEVELDGVGASFGSVAELGRKVVDNASRVNSDSFSLHVLVSLDYEWHSESLCDLQHECIVADVRRYTHDPRFAVEITFDAREVLFAVQCAPKTRHTHVLARTRRHTAGIQHQYARLWGLQD